MNKLFKQMKTAKGFTLIELLIVIAVIGLLAVALLSAINPAEQLKKARDASRKSDAAELLNALERYYTTFNNYPWGTATIATGSHPTFTSAGNMPNLITSSELKTQFTGRQTVVGQELFVTEDANNNVSVCFVPESNSARVGGLGALRNIANTTAGTCASTYNASSTAAGCYVCVPQ